MIKNQSTKLKALSEIASIDVTLEFGSILNQILKITCETMNAHSGTIMLVDEVTKNLEMAASYGLPCDYIERVYELAKKSNVPISTSPSGIVLETGKYYLVPNVFEEPRDKPWVELSKELGFSSQIFTPMKKGSKVIGLLNVYNAQVHDFTDEEIDFFSIAASQASSVVQNARMCSRLKKNIFDLKDYEQHLQEKIRLSHNKLFESEARFRELFDNASDCIYTINLDGQFLTANNSVAKTLKCTSVEEVLLSNMSKWMTPESLEKARKFIQEIITEEDYYNKTVVLEIICKDGKHVWFENKARPIKDNNNNIIGLHGSGREITEKIRLEQELKESEAKYRDLFEKANDPMYIHDVNGFILNVNQAGLDGLKCTRKEFIGSNISKWLTKESFLKFQERLIKRMSGEPMEQPVVIELICKDGEHRWAEIRTTAVYENGKVNAIHGIARDITEKKRLEEKLRESEEKYRDLFENAQDAMYVISIEGNFLKMNQVGLQGFGYSREEFIGSNISKFVTPESLKIVKDRQKKRLLGEIVNQTDVMEMICKNGEHRWIEIKTRDIKDGDRTKEIHGIARDITENIILKQKLKKTNNQYKLLCHLVEGSRGGKTRAIILKYLVDKSYNANQLAKAMNMDYKTIRHHLNVLIKNGIITKNKDRYIDLYYLSQNIEFDLNEFTQENKARLK